MNNKYLKPVLDLVATGEKIKNLIKAKGISVRQLQAIMGFPYVQTIYNWFAGKNMPTIDNLVVLAQILDVKIDEMVVTELVETEIECADQGLVEGLMEKPSTQNQYPKNDRKQGRGIQVWTA